MSNSPNHDRALLGLENQNLILSVLGLDIEGEFAESAHESHGGRSENSDITLLQCMAVLG